MNGNFRHQGIRIAGWRPKARALGLGWFLAGTLLTAFAGLTAPTAVHANEIEPRPEPNMTAVTGGAATPAEQLNLAEPPKTETPTSTGAPGPSFKATVRALVEQEARTTGLPADIAEAVVHVESDYDPSAIGGVGEIGLMQIRPETAAMLGFRGSAEQLAKPETNIHYGVTYLSKAWRLANGDLCRTLMKYRAGHGEEIMTRRSVEYCDRARSHLAALGSLSATQGTTPPAIIPALVGAEPAAPGPRLNSPTDVYAKYRQGTPAASRAFWTAHEARIRAITAQIEAKWHRVASR